MELDFEKLQQLKQDKPVEQVKQAKTRKKQAVYEPTWEEVWYTGWGKKKGIYKLNTTRTDKNRLDEVKKAIELGQLETGVKNLRNFTKAHALRLYRVLKDSQREDYINTTIKNMPKNYLLINTSELFVDLLGWLSRESEIALDTETTGLGEHDNICGISMTLPKADKHVYIPVRHNTPVKQLSVKTVMDKLRPFFQSKKLGKILHNARFDAHMLYKERIDLKGITMDTMIAMHVLTENEMSYALKNLATKFGKYFGFEDKSWKYEELFGKGGFENTPLDIGTFYACKDTHLTYKLATWIRSFFIEQPALGKAVELESRLIDVTIRMERRGMLIDKQFVDKYLQDLQIQKDELEGWTMYHTGIDNLNSNHQLLKYLQANVDSSIKSSDKKVLKPLRKDNEAIDMLLKFRKLDKIYGTYIKPIPEKAWSDGRIHPSFNQRGTVTSRWSSNNPNFQNLPYEAREMMVAGDGRLFYGIDFSQQEVRYMAHLTGDKDLQTIYKEGKDIYSSLASKVFNKPMQECLDGSKYRKAMKMGVLAVMYGISAFQLTEQIYNMTDGEIDMNTEDAEQFLQDFKDAYPTMSAWIEQTEQFAIEYGYVPIHGGFKRRFPELKEIHKKIQDIKKNYGDPLKIWQNYKLPYDKKRLLWDNYIKKYYSMLRQGVNARIQGGSAVMTKLAMINLQEYIDCNVLDIYIVATVHDEILFDVPESTSKEVIDQLALIMCNALPMDIPMKSDIQIMKKWGIDWCEGWQVTNAKNF